MTLSDQAANNSYDHAVSCSLHHGDVTQEQMLLSQLGSAAKQSAISLEDTQLRTSPKVTEYGWRYNAIYRCTLNELNPFKGAIDLIM